jgi:hypothetical protein
MTTLPATRREAAAAARALRCGICWAGPGVACQRHPEADHLGRYVTARTSGGITETEIGAILAGLDVIMNTALVEVTP